jgi:phospholipase/carboxylesterase
MAEDVSRFGVLSTKAAPPTQQSLPRGLQWPLGEDSGAPALFVPSSLPDGPLPLVVLLHGATSNPRQVLPIMQEEAEQRRFLLFAPKSQDITWDGITSGFGPDVEAIDRGLALVFDHFDVDSARVAVAGFSDGASYALSLGLANGELFSRIFAFSPGFVVPGPRIGRPLVFLSHGREDRILPLHRCGYRVATKLMGTGYLVDYREFNGGHEVPPEAAALALDLLLVPR